MVAKPCKHENIKEGCHICGLCIEISERGKKYRELFGIPESDRYLVVVEGNCIYLGEDTGEKVQCSTCTKKVMIKVYRCEKHGKCTQGMNYPGYAFCNTCKDKCTKKEIIYKEKFPIKFDENNLDPEGKGKRFNSSLIVYEDGYILAYRTGWSGSQILLVKLDKHFNILGDPWNLSLTHKDEGNYGVEDPRLFVFDNDIHISYIGVVVKKKYLYTSQLYARLTKELKVERTYYPLYAKRNSWEKNWQFFEYEKQLYAIYSVNNHKILKIDGSNASMAYENGSYINWDGGEIRGGAAPYLVGDQWYCFFHDHVKDLDGHKIYRMGLLTFENKPPFRITRISSEAIITADRKTNKENYASVMWPGGVVLKNDTWYISFGVHDRWTEIHKFDFGMIESKLVRVQCLP